MTVAAPESALLRRTRWRLLAWSGGSTLAVLLLLGTAIYLAAAGALDAEATTLLRQRAIEMVEGLPVDDRGRPQIPEPIGDVSGSSVALLGPFSGTAGLLVGPGETLEEAHTTTVEGLGSGLDLPYWPGITRARQGRESIETVDLAGTSVRVLSQPLAAPDGSIAVVQVIGDRGPEERALGTVRSVLGIGGAGMLGLAIVLGWLYSGRALVPIRESLRRQREFAADVSHELRTPLAVVRATAADLEARREEPIANAGADLEEIAGQVDHMTELIDELLLYARAESGAVELASERVDLADAAASASARLRRLADRAGVRLTAELTPVEVVGDARRLAQLVGILVENAVRHGPTGSGIVVRVGVEAGGARLEVEDEGPGIPPAELERIFDRFGRGTAGRPGGVGLGLAIARWIADRHGGRLTAANRPGGGARFSLLLPLAD